MVKKNRIEVLDGLRGLAVLIVFLSHTSGRDHELVGFLNFLGIGHIGVYLFFTLSAFLLGMGLFSKPLNSESLKAFFIKRSLRIIPLYYFIVSCVFACQIIFDSYSTKYLRVSNGLTGYIEHLIFYRGDGIFWSIVSEIQFYLIVPLLVWIIIKYKRKGIILLLIVSIINFILYLLKYADLSDLILYISPNTMQRGTFIDIFLPGLLTAYLVVFNPNLLKKYRELIHKTANIIFFLGGALTLIFVSKNFLGFHQPFYEFRFFSLPFGICFSIITLSLFMENNLLNPFFRIKFLRFIGKIGFSFYLIHLAVFQQVNKIPIESYIKFLLSFGIVISLSYISFYLIEKPSIKISYKLINYFKLIRKKKIEKI